MEDGRDSIDILCEVESESSMILWTEQSLNDEEPGESMRCTEVFEMFERMPEELNDVRYC